jgi:hypothetical protein
MDDLFIIDDIIPGIVEVPAGWSTLSGTAPAGRAGDQRVSSLQSVMAESRHWQWTPLAGELS